MREIIAIILVVPANVALVFGFFAIEKVREYRSGGPAIYIKARAPEKGNFTPQKVTVPAGEKARLRVRNVDTVTHGFAIPELGVDAGAIQAGHMVTLEFTPQKAGTYDFYCTEWCSEFHLQMRGILEVVAR